MRKDEGGSVRDGIVADGHECYEQKREYREAAEEIDELAPPGAN